MMKRFLLFPFFLLWTFCLISCSPANNKPISIQFSPDSTAIVVSGIDRAGLLQIRNTSPADTANADLITVLQRPADEDTTGTEIPVDGKIVVTKDELVFIPSKSFISGTSYLVISYMNSKFGSPGMLIRGKLSYSVKPQQVILKR